MLSRRVSVKPPAINPNDSKEEVVSQTSSTVSTVKTARTNMSGADMLVLLCVVIWAFNVPFVKSLLPTLAPLEISMTRYGIGAIFFVIFVLVREHSLAIAWRHLPLMLAAGVIGITLNQIFFVYALNNTTSSEVSLLMASTPSFAAIFAWILGQEKIKLNYWLSLPIAAAGVALIVLTAPGAHLAGNLTGDFLALLTSASWAGYTVLIRPLLKHYSIGRISAYMLVIGVLAMLPFGLPQMNLEHYARLTPGLWLTLAYCTLIALVITNFLWYGGVKFLGAPRTAFYAYLQPFFGVIAAFFILNETIVPWQILGGGLIVLSMIMYRSNLYLKLLRLMERKA